jgi:hypothetical protein
MECTGCGSELTHVDTFGFFNKRFHGDFQKSGDIYRCESEPKEGEEECPSEVHNRYFWTRRNSDELIEGYPC